MERVRKISETYPVFKQIEQKSSGQVKAEHVFIGASLIVFLALFSRCMAPALTNAVALLLVVGPATSLIVGKSLPELGTVKHIISYMLTFVLFTCVDSVVPFMHRKIPFYYHGKLLFFYYLSVRKSQFTDYLNTSLYVHIYDMIKLVNSSASPKDQIKAAQTAAAEKVKEISETAKDVAAAPEKEE
ncbi:hypothetical protein NEDG_01066 [Nematocida displodere]|uniref:Uncharacterized protein n=1 Tax=Nematocida displodere TaxID=1805483 RepID=A0A177EAG8_9MICR|nr:hypothetical protein NEDG_01066 [Nematocida displodere]